MKIMALILTFFATNAWATDKDATCYLIANLESEVVNSKDRVCIQDASNPEDDGDSSVIITLRSSADGIDQVLATYFYYHKMMERREGVIRDEWSAKVSYNSVLKPLNIFVDGYPAIDELGRPIELGKLSVGKDTFFYRLNVYEMLPTPPTGSLASN